MVAIRYFHRILQTVYLRRPLQLACSLLLLGVLLFGNTPREFIHLFTVHEDTVHVRTSPQGKNELSFDSVHHHCSFLDDALAPFVPTETITLLWLSGLVHHPLPFAHYQYRAGRMSIAPALRGPPPGVVFTA